jgi:hypothetical protein
MDWFLDNGGERDVKGERTIECRDRAFTLSTVRLETTLTGMNGLFQGAEGGFFGRARLTHGRVGRLAFYTGGEGSDFGETKRDGMSWPSYQFSRPLLETCSH